MAACCSQCAARVFARVAWYVGGQTNSTLGELARRSKVETGVAEHAEVSSGAGLVGELGFLERHERASQRRPERVRLGRGRAAVSGLKSESGKDCTSANGAEERKLHGDYSQCSAASR